MLAKDLMSEVVFPLRTSDTGMQALNLMDVYRISHLPIVNDKEFLGLISDNDVIDLNDPEAPVGNHELSLQKAFVYHNQHLYDVIEVISRLKLSLVPVLDDEKNYLGLITLVDLMQRVADLFSLKQPGAILAIEVNNQDYTLSEIAQIVEGNDTKIISLYIDSSSEDIDRLSLYLKLNRTDIGSVLQTFERYDYNVRAFYTDEEEAEELLDERYESFMRFLNP